MPAVHASYLFLCYVTCDQSLLILGPRFSSALKDSAVNEEIAKAFNVTPPFGLEDFTYSSHKLQEIIFKHLANTSFNGLSVSVG